MRNLAPHAKLRVLLASVCERFDMAASWQARVFLYRLRSTPPKTLQSFRRHLRAQRAIRLLFLPRGFFSIAVPAFPRSEVRKNRHEPGWAPPRPAPPLSRFRATGRVRTTRAPSVRVVVTRAAFCGTKCRTLGSSWFRPSPKHDPPFSLRDLPGSRWQVLADARCSLTLVRELGTTLRSRSGYNHLRRLPIDLHAGTRIDRAWATKPRTRNPVQYAANQTHTCAHDRRTDRIIAR